MSNSEPNFLVLQRKSYQLCDKSMNCTSLTLSINFPLIIISPVVVKDFFYSKKVNHDLKITMLQNASILEGCE